MHRNDFYNRIEEGFVRTMLQQVTDHFYGRGLRPAFIEVGANDGVSSSKVLEFIRDHEWHGLLVEPVPATFARLRENMAPYPRVQPVHCAIADKAGTLPFYQVIGSGERSGDTWLPMLSSFDAEVIRKQRVFWPDIEDHITQIEVPAMTLASLCAEHQMPRLDVLLVDAEGYDDIVVRSLNFDTYKPILITIEHLHLSPQRLRALDGLLTALGYQRCILWMDSWYFCGDILKDQCIQDMLRVMPTLMPVYDRQYGNGYWMSHYD